MTPMTPKPPAVIRSSAKSPLRESSKPPIPPPQGEIIPRLWMREGGRAIPLRARSPGRLVTYFTIGYLLRRPRAGDVVLRDARRVARILRLLAGIDAARGAVRVERRARRGNGVARLVAEVL